MKHAFTISAVVAQLLAILLLQWYPIAPHLGHKATRPQCRGNHAECGCSPERIAAHTCCCYHHKPACCNKDGGQEEEHFAGRSKGPSSPHLSAAPCGGSPKFITASLDKLKFLHPESILTAPAGCSLSHSRSLPETASSRSTEPPEPPPKLSISA